MKFNDEQQACLDAIDGIHVVIAGPGSGKTTTLVQRYLGMLTRGIQSKDILNLTFTSAAAAEMVKRVGLLDSESVFRTFHSFAIELLKKERAELSFKLCDTVIPVGMEDYALVFDLVKRYPVIKNFRTLMEKISCWKRTNVEPRQAKAEASNQEFFYALAYEDYEKECREQGWLDFDSVIRETVLLLEFNEGVRDRWKRKYIAVDECQDTDVVQFRLLQLIFHGNIFVVGDENQCQPPETEVSVLVKEKCGRSPAIVKSVPIEDICSCTDRLVSWDSKGKRIRLGSGRRFKRAVRYYRGWMLRIHSGKKTTRVTPNHFMWVKFDKDALNKGRNYFVYLMWKKDVGFRLGTSRFRRVSGSNQLSHRGYQEGANKMWILRVLSSQAEAEFWEEVYSLRYGIPECSFHNKYNNSKKTQEQINQIFREANPDGGRYCLSHHRLLFEHPLVSWPHKKHLTKFHGYFKTVAANIIPALMRVPTEISYDSAIINDVSREMYSGLVYSLDVEKDHTYVADGIPVGNCIYEWRSAQPGNMSGFSKKFSGAKSLYLGQNYRSTKRLVEFFKKILPVDNGIASHMITDNEEGVDPVFKKYSDSHEEAYWVLAQISDPANSAVIARTNRQLFEFQKVCAMKGIKYKILGKKDYFELNEVRKLLALAKDSGSQLPANVVLQNLIDQHNLVYLYRNSATKDSNPIENLNDLVRMAAGKGTIHEFTNYLRKRTHGRKSAKGLTLSTVHGSKGREFSNVFLIGCNQGMMPHKEGELMEEERIFFVGCTRAADFLHISYTNQPSQFILEFLNDKML